MWTNGRAKPGAEEGEETPVQASMAVIVIAWTLVTALGIVCARRGTLLSKFGPPKNLPAISNTVKSRQYVTQYQNRKQYESDYR
jgi:hypothetical protein